MRLIAGLFLLLSVTALADDKDGVAVVYNPRLDGSEELAEYYARKRGLSDDQLIALPCSPNEVIPRPEFLEHIQKPLIEKLVEKGWWKIRKMGPGDGDWSLVESRLKYLVLCHGIPLRIEEVPPDQTGDVAKADLGTQNFTNSAGVDSELAVLPNPKSPLAGLVKNPFFGRAGFDSDPNWNRKIVLVTRLDGPNAEVARRLVDSALAGEQQGLWGRAVVDMRGIVEGPYAAGDKWLAGIAAMLRSGGWNPYVDRNEELIVNPGPFRDCAIYAGWYAGSVAGPPSDPKFQFRPGAIAYHIHSYSAATLRSYRDNWAGPLVAHGAAASMGCVNEPFLQFSPYIDYFFKQMLFGNNLAQSAYLSIPALSWQNVVLGDPLYRPFGKSIDSQREALRLNNDPNLAWAELMAVSQLADAGAPDKAIARLEELNAARPSLLYQERLAELYTAKRDHARSVEAWKKCVEQSNSSSDRAASILSLARAEALAGQPQQALNDFRKFVENFPDHPSRVHVAREARSLARARGLSADEQFFARLIPPEEKK